MPELSEKAIGCPYCGEIISILAVPSVPEQEYIEDCQVCCRPMILRVTVITEDEIEVSARSESE